MHRPRTTLLCAILVATLSLGAVAFALPAAAATPSPTPAPSESPGNFVAYTGTEHVRAYDTDGTQTQNQDIEVTYRVTCTPAGSCVTRVPRATLTLKDGAASVTVPEAGDPCDAQTWNGVVTISVAVTATSYVLKYHSAPSGDRNCAGGVLRINEQFLDFTGKVSAGDPCVLDSSCRTVSTAASPGKAGTGSSGPRVATTPSVLSTLPVAASALTPRNALWAAAAAVVLVLLIALPTQLFNSASEKASERIGQWWARLRPTRKEKSPAGEATAPVAWSGWPFAALGVLGASVISAFVDPNLSFDGASVRTILSILVSFILDVVIGWFVLLLIVRRTHPETIATFEFKPLTLVVVAVAVLLTRITGFQPGIVFGLVAGIAFGGVIGTAKARVALTGLGYSFAIGVLAWVGYSAISSAGGSHPGAVLVFAQESLSSAAIAGIAALPIALIPVGALVGREVWAWNRIAWGVAYAIGLVGFFLVLMPMPFAWAEVPLSLWTWIGLYLSYALVAVVLWLVITQPWKREKPEASSAA